MLGSGLETLLTQFGGRGLRREELSCKFFEPSRFIVEEREDVIDERERVRRVIRTIQVLAQRFS